MNIIVDFNYPIQDGAEVKFRSPVDCSQVTGLIVNYNGGSQEFMFADAHGNNVGDIDHLFAEDVVVKVILDLTTSMAFVQNADTNAYLEGRFAEIEGKIGSGGGGGTTEGAVLYSTLQNLTEDQKTRARFNIDAVGYEELGFEVGKCVSAVDKQDFLEDMKAQARENIGAASQEEIGDIESALDSILAIQNALIGGDGV